MSSCNIVTYVMLLQIFLTCVHYDNTLHWNEWVRLDSKIISLYTLTTSHTHLIQQYDLLFPFSLCYELWFSILGEFFLEF